MSTNKEQVKAVDITSRFGEWVMNPRTGKKNLRPNFKALIEYALSEDNKGKISEMFSQFYDYSLYNTMILGIQMMAMGRLQPVLCPSKWKRLGYEVVDEDMKLTALVPQMKVITIKEVDSDGVERLKKLEVPAFFKWVDKFYPMSATDCKDESKVAKKLSEQIMVDPVKICKELKIEIVEFNEMNGNCGGYSLKDEKKIAINPAFTKDSDTMMSTLFHEIAHALLHTKHRKDVNPNRGCREVEAELTSFLVCASLNKDFNADTSIGYIKGWLKRAENKLTDDMSKHIMDTANNILKAIKKTSK